MDMKNYLTIDIGNTRSKYAVFQGSEIVETNIFDPFKGDIADVFVRHPEIDKAIISSVSGKIDEVSARLEMPFEVLTSETKLPFTFIRDGIGSDRLALAAAAYSIAPDQNVLVIDIGTCITYDLITADHHLCCGPISPGLRLRYLSMNEHTSALPLMRVEEAETPLVCTSTEECLHSGVIRSVEYELKGFIGDFMDKIGNMQVFITGGDNIFFEKRLKNCNFARPNFLFEGLRFILEYGEDN